MYRRRRGPSTRLVLLLVLMALILMAGCAAPQATPAQTDEATPTQAAVSTATEPPEPPTIEAAVATEIVTVTTTPAEAEATPAASGETSEPGQEVAYEFPVKGQRDAPVTIIEFSDYL